MKKSIIVAMVFLIIVFISSTGFSAGSEISGNFEVGDRLYSDITDDEDGEEEIIDQYQYKKLWLRYKEPLEGTDYYYLRVQLYDKEYQEKLTYNNQSIELQGNYTYQLSDKLRNKWLVTLRDKEYTENKNSTYNMLRVNYQLDFKQDNTNKYTINLQRQWQNYKNADDKDNVYDRISLNWKHKYSQKLEFNSKLSFNREEYEIPSDRSNKLGRVFSLGFKYKL